MSKLSRRFPIRHWPEIIFIIFTLVFSFWLMTKTFNSNPKAGTLTIAGKAYSDFAANLPLIRSFSWGENFPPEYPLFPGEPIRYHFLFYLLVGMLEKGGIPLGWALNLPSALGFGALLLMIYFLAKLLFKSRTVAFLAVLFFLFNGSFGFYYFFQTHPLSFPQTIFDVFNTQTFSAFGPYDKGTVTAFWNLNIYTNQRHFASGLFFVLLLLYFFLQAHDQKRVLSFKTTLFLGVLVGLLPFWHATGFIMALVILGGLFVFLPQRRRIFLTLLVTLLLAFPQFFYLLRSGGISSFHFHPGYLVASELSPFNFLRFWFLNLGLAVVLIPLGVFFASPKARTVFGVVLPIFLLGNLFQFSPDMAINHKFFNLFLIIGNMFIAYFLVRIWSKNIFTKVLTVILFFFLTLSGIIDFFAIKNDRLYTLLDAPRNPDIAWIKQNTPPSAIFLNSSYLYHPASLAGRKIFLGWPYFPWSAGYDTNKRFALQKKIYQGGDVKEICRMLKENKIDYLTVDSFNDSELGINFSFFEKNFKQVYKNQLNRSAIYETASSCNKILPRQ